MYAVHEETLISNHSPESAQLTTQQLIGFVIYIVVFVPIMFVHPSRLQPVLAVSLVTTTCTMSGMFIWVGLTHTY